MKTGSRSKKKKFSILLRGRLNMFLHNQIKREKMNLS